MKDYGVIRDYRYVKQEKVLKVLLDAENKGGADSLRLSDLYWKDRWFERLDSEAKYFLFYLLWKTHSGKLGRSVQMTQEDISKDFEMASDSLTKASRQLQRFNLIEKEVLSREQERIPNRYTLNDFYVYEDFEKGLGKVKESSDPELFEVSMKLCDAVNEPCDLRCLKEVLEAGKKHGVLVLRKAYEKVSRAKANSAYNRFPYMMTVIENMASVSGGEGN